MVNGNSVHWERLKCFKFNGLIAFGHMVFKVLGHVSPIFFRSPERHGSSGWSSVRIILGAHLVPPKIHSLDNIPFILCPFRIDPPLYLHFFPPHVTQKCVIYQRNIQQYVIIFIRIFEIIPIFLFINKWQCCSANNRADINNGNIAINTIWMSW